MASDITLVPTIANLGALNSNCPALGSLVFYGGKWYAFVQYKDAVTYVASPGMVLTWADTACTTVTNDRAGGSSIGQIPAGIACIAGAAAAVQNNYGFVQLSGVATVGPTDGAVALGELVVPHASTDGGVDTWSGTLKPFGVALADDVSTTSVIVRLHDLI